MKLAWIIRNEIATKIQRRVFEEQLGLPVSSMPVAIHNRDAFEDTYAILKTRMLKTLVG